MASSPTLPPISSLPTADEETIKSVLDTLFEPSPEIHALAIPAIQGPKHCVGVGVGVAASEPENSNNVTDRLVPFTSYASLIECVGDLMKQLTSSPSSSSSSSLHRDKLHGILGSHPRLGARKVESAQSRAEQAQLQSSSDEAEKLAALNQEYEARFPGLRYVVFVNGRGRDIIMQDMRRRIDRGDMEAEEREGVQAMIDIALDRAKKLQPATT